MATVWYVGIPHMRKMKMMTIKNYLHGFKQLVKYFLGIGILSEKSKKLEYRRAHCQVCEHRKGNICMPCGCYITVKTAVKNESCPLGYW
jgi:hypothetical protein